MRWRLMYGAGAVVSALTPCPDVAGAVAAVAATPAPARSPCSSLHSSLSLVLVLWLSGWGASSLRLPAPCSLTSAVPAALPASKHPPSSMRSLGGQSATHDFRVAGVTTTWKPGQLVEGLTAASFGLVCQAHVARGSVHTDCATCSAGSAPMHEFIQCDREGSVLAGQPLEGVLHATAFTASRDAAAGAARCCACSGLWPEYPEAWSLQGSAATSSLTWSRKSTSCIMPAGVATGSGARRNMHGGLKILGVTKVPAMAWLGLLCESAAGCFSAHCTAVASDDVAACACSCVLLGKCDATMPFASVQQPGSSTCQACTAARKAGLPQTYLFCMAGSRTATAAPMRCSMSSHRLLGTHRRA